MFLAGIQGLVSSLSDNPPLRLRSGYAQDRLIRPYQGASQPSYPPDKGGPGGVRPQESDSAVILQTVAKCDYCLILQLYHYFFITN